MERYHIIKSAFGGSTVYDSAGNMVGYSLPGVLGGGAAATARESFGEDGLLESPQYTRPPVYRGDAVPDVLVDGDHGKADAWRKRQAIDLTSRRRPDLIARGGTLVAGF